MSINPFRPYIYGAIGVAFLLLLLWGLRVDHLRADWKDRFEGLTEEAASVLASTRRASDNPKLTWKNAAQQIDALGDNHRVALASIEEQNAAIDDMAREAVRLRKRADELQRIADRAAAQRREALRRLADMSITPGTREDCETLLAEAEEALNLVRDAGL